MLFDNGNYVVKYYDFLLNSSRTVLNTVIADSNVATFTLLIYSGVPLIPYKSDMPFDEELIGFAKYLDKLAECKSIYKEINSAVQKALFD